MKVEDFIKVIGADFYTGVPDSQLRSLCDYLYNTYGIDGHHHMIAANEGNAVGIAAGYYLATGKIPVVYMQNSGEGNIINPLASLLNEKVYAIPCIFIIGWRGEPGVHDEPQHIFQGEITCKLLEIMGVRYEIISSETSIEEIKQIMNDYRKLLAQGRSVSFVVRKKALTYNGRIDYKNKFTITREEIIRCIVKAARDDLIVCTTGKASRELFEIRESNRQGHEKDFLTVGSMGHASSIAIGIALNTDKKVWCIDGDGAMLMHMGAMAVIGSIKAKNLIHIVINNGSHETVGGMPTVASEIELFSIAEACGYSHIYKEIDLEQLEADLEDVAKMKESCFIEVKCGIGSRVDLGRPTITAVENKIHFIKYLR